MTNLDTLLAQALALVGEDKRGELGLTLATKDGKPFPATLPVGWSTETRARAVEYVRGVVEQAEAATKAA